MDERPQQRTEIKSNDGHERETPWPVLPLCTVVYEFVDAGDEVWVDTKMVLRAPDERAENLQILHEVVEFGPPSGTLVRCFKISPSLFSWSTIQCHRRRQIGVYTRAVRILPPAPFRAPSINLPAEILRLIFEEAVSIDQSMFGHWRLALLSFSLVCRSWTIARECLFREFGDHVLESSRPDPTAVAHALQLNPVLGRAIRRFGFDHFCCQRDLTFDIAMIGILKTATFMRHLNAYDTHPMLGKQFVEAICVSREMRVFTNHRGPLKPGEERYLMSAADLEKCVSHWPLLHTLEIHAFSSLRDEDQETDQQYVYFLFHSRASYS